MNGVLCRIIACSAVLCTGGCADDVHRAGAVSTAIDTVGGIVFVRNAGAPAQWSLTELRSLGSAGMVGEPRDDEFGRIVGVLADGAGNIYVADATATEIRVFPPTDGPVRRMGRRGAGPAEYATLQSIGWLGDTLAVLDPGNGRLGLFSRDGEWLGQRPYMALSGAQVRLYATGANELYMPFVRGGSIVFVRQTAAGTGDTLAYDIAKPGATEASEVLAQSRRLSVVCRHSANRGISSYVADIAPRAIVVPAPNGLRAAVWSSEYRVAFVNSVGDTTRVVERDVPVQPVADELWAEQERRFREFLDQFDDESCEPRTLPRPDSRRIILDVAFDDTQRIWVERETDTGRAFDVFMQDGELLATVDSPVRNDRVPVFIRGDRLYLVVRDSLDIEYVKEYEVTEADR